MHPGDVLASAGDRSADPEAEERQHLRQRAALGRQNDSGTRDRRPEARWRPERLVLPRRPRPRRGSRLRPGRPRHGLIVARAVEAGGGLGDEHGRPVVGRQREQPVHQVAGAGHARVPDGRLGLRRPALRHRLAEQMHDGVGAGQRGLGRGLVGGPRPGVRLDTRSERLASAPLVAGERHDLVAAVQEHVDQDSTDQAGGAGDDNSHRPKLAGLGRSSHLRIARHPQMRSNAAWSNGISQHSAIRPSTTRNTPTVSHATSHPIAHGTAAGELHDPAGDQRGAVHGDAERVVHHPPALVQVGEHAVDPSVLAGDRARTRHVPHDVVAEQLGHATRTRRRHTSAPAPRRTGAPPTGDRRRPAPSPARPR